MNIAVKAFTRIAHLYGFF